MGGANIHIFVFTGLENNEHEYMNISLSLTHQYIFVIKKTGKNIAGLYVKTTYKLDIQ